MLISTNKIEFVTVNHINVSLDEEKKLDKKNPSHLVTNRNQQPVVITLLFYKNIQQSPHLKSSLLKILSQSLPKVSVLFFLRLNNSPTINKWIVNHILWHFQVNG